jgi:hypothetical protein
VCRRCCYYYYCYYCFDNDDDSSVWTLFFSLLVSSLLSCVYTPLHAHSLRRASFSLIFFITSLSGIHHGTHTHTHILFFIFFLLSFIIHEWAIRNVLVNSFHFERASRSSSEKKRNYLNMCWRWIILIRQVDGGINSIYLQHLLPLARSFHSLRFGCSCKVIKRNYFPHLSLLPTPFSLCVVVLIVVVVVVPNRWLVVCLVVGSLNEREIIQ